ncbi:MAG: hypothetical protein GY832_12120 [Chloroflexi bacterium]|nr:hypothetical protein [Chloroflexota bacterium]
MINKKYHSPFILFTLLTMLVLTACSTLEIDIEQEDVSSSETVPTVVVLATEPVVLATEPVALATEETDLATSEVIATPVPVDIPTPIPAVTKLHVAFVQDTEHGNNVLLWTEGDEQAVPLTKDGGVSGVRISDDGEIVAFRRGGSLWMVTSDGADNGHPAEERELVSAEDIATMQVREPFDFEVVLNHYEWIPGTHILAFNTRLQMQIGRLLNNDLHLVNADTLEYTALLPPDKGGEFYPSPDGRQIAVVTPGAISLVRIDGSDRREVFTYTPIITYSEVSYYARPVWAADSGSLRVAIPPADPQVQPLPPTSVWHIRTDGMSASLVGNVDSDMEATMLSPGLRYAAYLDGGRTTHTANPISSLLITDLDNRETITYYPIDSGETTTERPAVTSFYGWSPDSQHFAFRTYRGSEIPSQALVGQLGGDTVPIYDDAEIIMTLRWVDANRYLFLANNPRGWAVMLGEIGGPVKSVTGIVDSSPDYDFASPPYDSTASTSGDAPVSTHSVNDHGDDLIAFGLVYQNSDGLWHVNADGQSAQIFEYPDTNQYIAWPAISPDGAQVLYTEENDIWLADVATGERRNLTQTPDRVECCAQWWPGQSDAILFNSWTEDNEGPNNGFPTMVQLDGSGYKVLDETQSAYALPAPSPDGQTVAYDQAGQPWLYRPGTGPEPFDLTIYGLSSDPQVRVISPAWSPDGRKIAWIVGGCPQGECQSDIGVFDLEAQTVQFVHSYSPVGRGGQPPAPVWSPDGHWLAFDPWTMGADNAGLWVVRVDGQQEEKYRLDTAMRMNYSPTWSPDGRWLAFASTPEGVGSGLWLAEVDTWILHSSGLPVDARLVGWPSPPGN